MENKENKIIRYEDAATNVQFNGVPHPNVPHKTLVMWRWVCNACDKLAQSEDSARRCCATDVPCSGKTCNNRIQATPNRHFITATQFCKECKQTEREQRYAKRRARWEAREKHGWDGEAMLFSDADDKFFRDLDELYDYYDEEIGEGTISSIDDLEIRICQPIKPPYFEMFEFLADCMPDEDDFYRLPPGYEEIEKMVNDYAQSQVLSWEPGPYALDISDEDMKGGIYPSAKYISPFDGTKK